MVDQAEALRRLTFSVETKRGLIKFKKIPRVITVTSGKGGVGKTNLVVNLGIALSRLGKRVIILDADLGMANADIMLGLIPTYNLMDVMNGVKALEDIMVSGPDGMKLIPGGSGLVELANMAVDQRNQLLNKLLSLDDLADILLIDTGAGISRTVLSFVSAADEVVVVTTPEPTAITDAYGIVKIIDKYHIHTDVGLVVNMVHDQQEGQEVYKRFSDVSSKFLQIDVRYLGGICSDQMVVRAVKEQQPFITLYPRTKAAFNVRQIAEKLINLSPNTARGMGGFLSRLSRLLGAG